MINKYYYLIIFHLIFFAKLAKAMAPLELQIVQLPPYLVVQPDGTVDGISVRPTMAAFKKMGIDVMWKEVPALRQLQRIKSNRERVCSVGWYKTKEREQFAKFSDYISQDAPWVGFANDSFNARAGSTLHAIFSDSDVIMLFKSGFVYGDYLDNEILHMKAQKRETNADMPNLLKMIGAGRAQITFAPIEEIQYYQSYYSIAANHTRIIKFNELSFGYKRYLMCSKIVEDDVISKFNIEIAAVRKIKFQ